MKLTISKEQLLAGLQAVQNVVSSRSTLAILSNVLMKARTGHLELTATDLDVAVVCSVPARVTEPGDITLPARKLVSIVKELSVPEVDFTLEEGSMVFIQAGSSSFKVHGLPASDYPEVPTLEESQAVTLSQTLLKVMLKRTSFAASTDESRFVLNGIFFCLKDQKLTLVATDGRRLAMTDAELELAEETEREFIVPTKAIHELNRLLGTGSLEVKVGINQVGFTMKPEDENAFPTYIISKLVDGNYPNYRQVIPQEVQERVTLPREELYQALKRVELMTSDKSNSVKLSFTKNQLAITANTQDVGEARDVLTINYKGKDVAIAFNPGYLMDPLRALDNDEVYFELIDALSPGVVKCAEPYLYVIMPMRMN
jgi:DNA polymerase-3 subunit beta